MDKTWPWWKQQCLYYPAFDKTYTPSTGDVIIFPSNWMFYHKVTEITSGNRYAGTVWYYYGSNKPIKKGASHVERFSKWLDIKCLKGRLLKVITDPIMSV